jgi:hypothetical protein
VGKIAQREAISVERMRVEMANFVDGVRPVVKKRIKDMVTDEDLDLS